MWNGWRKAAIGMSALLTFILLEVTALFAGVTVFLSVVMDLNLPFLADTDNWAGRPPGPPGPGARFRSGRGISVGPVPKILPAQGLFKFTLSQK